MKVIGYIRVSTQGQARDGYSLAYQEDEIKTYCQTHGYTLLRLFKDEGISGAKVDEEALEVDRLGFQEMVKSENDEILYYEGGIPTNSAYISEMKKDWSNVPESIMEFYEKLHNGFYYLPSRAMGLVQVERITHFEGHEWGILEELDEPLGINMSTTYGFFENGMGDMLL